MINKDKRKIRHFKVRKKVVGTKEKPRLSIFRSNKNIYAQIIDDSRANSLAAISTFKLKGTKENNSDSSIKFEQAQKAGEELAKIAVKKKILKVVFDRGGFKFHGRIKAFAKAARKGGLIF